MGKLLLLFTTVPLLEFFLLFRLSEVMGLGATIALVLVTGALGAMLAKAEGLRVLRSWQGALAEGRVPEEGVVSGLLVLVGGVLLVTPGVMTDALGLCLLMPATRHIVAQLVVRRIEAAIERGEVRVVHSQWTGAPSGFTEPGGFGGAGGYRRSTGGRPEMIDVEAKVVEAKVIDTSE